MIEWKWGSHVICTFSANEVIKAVWIGEKMFASCWDVVCTVVDFIFIKVYLVYHLYIVIIESQTITRLLSFYISKNVCRFLLKCTERKLRG